MKKIQVECVYKENTSDKWHVPRYPTRNHLHFGENLLNSRIDAQIAGVLQLFALYTISHM